MSRVNASGLPGRAVLILLSVRVPPHTALLPENACLLQVLCDTCVS